MQNEEVLQLYVQLLPFLAQVCGPGSEVVVHDISDPDHSLRAIRNNLSGRQTGGTMMPPTRELLAQIGDPNADFVLNQPIMSSGGELLSSVYFIRNEGQVIGLLCVNKDTAAVQELNSSLRAVLERFNLTKPQTAAEESDTSVAALVRERIAAAIAECGMPPARMSMQEKVRVVHRLNSEGVLVMKGAVSEIAAQLSVSVPTVYRYLNKPVSE